MAYSTNISNGLPDPIHDAEFYFGVPIRRGIAWVIDVFIIIVVSVIAVILTLGIALFFAGLLFIVIGFIYRAGFLAARSATPGMMIMGIELRTLDGQKFETRDGLIHTAIYSLVFMSVIGQTLSIITMLTTEYGRGLPDFVLGSTAINRPL